MVCSHVFFIFNERGKEENILEGKSWKSLSRHIFIYFFREGERKLKVYFHLDFRKAEKKENRCQISDIWADY